MGILERPRDLPEFLDADLAGLADCLQDRRRPLPDLRVVRAGRGAKRPHRRQADLDEPLLGGFPN